MDDRRVGRWAAYSGLAAFAAFTVANLIWALEQPAPNASPTELVAFYTDGSTRITIGGLASLSSYAIWIVFASALRRVVGGLAGDVTFGGALFGLAAGTCAESINAVGAMRAANGTLTEPLALVAFDLSYIFGSYAMGVGFGLVALALGTTALREERLLPRGIALLALVVGVAMVIPLAAGLIGEYVLVPYFVVHMSVCLHLLRSEDRPALGGRGSSV